MSTTITNLPDELLAPDDADVLVIDDVSEVETKKISVASLRAAIVGGAWPLLAPDGTAVAPIYSFEDEEGTGAYLAGADQYGIATAGAARAHFHADGSILFSDWLPSAGNTHDLGSSSAPWLNLYAANINLIGQGLFADGNVTTPGIAFSAEPATGIYRPASKEIAFAANNTQQFRITSSGVFAPNVRPMTTNTHSLGLTAERWLDIWATTHYAGDGAVGTPTWTFASDPNTGVYWLSTGAMGVTGDGLQVVRFQAPSGASPQTIHAAGSAAAPAVASASETTTGMYWPAGGQIGFAIQGAIQFYFASSAGSVRLLPIGTGSAAVPVYSWNSSGASGHYLAASHQPAIAVEGLEVMRWKAPSGANPQALFASGSASLPGISFTSDTSTGLQLAGVGTINLVTGGTARWFFNSNSMISLAGTGQIGASSGGVIDIAGRLNTSVGNLGPTILLSNQGAVMGGNSGVGTHTQLAFSTANQTGTAGWTAFSISITDSASTGAKLLADWKVGGTTYFSVDNTGTTRLRLLYTENGDSADPSHSFKAETGTGMFRDSGTGDLRFSIQGLLALSMSSASSWVIPGADQVYDLGEPNTLWARVYSSRFLAEDGSAAVPAYAFITADDTGLANASQDLLLCSAGLEVLRVSGNSQYIIPGADNTYVLGDASLRFANFFAAQTTIGARVETTAEVQTTTSGNTVAFSLTLDDNAVYWLKAVIIGRRSDNGARAYYERSAYFFRAGGAATMGTVQTPITDESDAAWNATLGVDGANAARVLVAGVAATTINWHVTITYAKV